MPVPAHATPRLAVAALLAILLGRSRRPPRRIRASPSRDTATATAWECRSTARRATRSPGQLPADPRALLPGHGARARHAERADPRARAERPEERLGRERDRASSRTTRRAARRSPCRLGDRHLERRRLRRRERRRHAARERLGRPRAVHARPRRAPSQLVGTALFGGANRTYRGALRVIEGASGLDAVNVLALEDYLRGVVPSEVPSSWRPAALEAQAVAARGYALATAQPVGTLFDEYADTRSQAYAGMQAETPQTDAAIAATSGLVLMLRRRARHDLLLVVERRRDGERAGGVPRREADAVPGRRPRSLRHGLAVPRLDGDASRAPRSRRRSATRARSRASPSRRTLGPRADADGPGQRRLAGVPGRHRAHRALAALDLVHDGRRDDGDRPGDRRRRRSRRPCR